MTTASAAARLAHAAAAARSSRARRGARFPTTSRPRSSATASSATRASGVGRERARDCGERREPRRRPENDRAPHWRTRARGTPTRGERSTGSCAEQPLALTAPPAPRSCSTREGPIPGTSSSSSTTAKRTVRSPVVDDLLPPSPARSRAASRAARPSPHSAAPARPRRPSPAPPVLRDRDRQPRRHDELLAVGDGRRQIYAGGVRLAALDRPLRHRVGDPRPARHAIQARPPHRADHVHHEPRGRRSRGSAEPPASADPTIGRSSAVDAEGPCNRNRAPSSSTTAATTAPTSTRRRVSTTSYMRSSVARKEYVSVTAL